MQAMKGKTGSIQVLCRASFQHYGNRLDSLLVETSVLPDIILKTSGSAIQASGVSLYPSFHGWQMNALRHGFRQIARSGLGLLAQVEHESCGSLLVWGSGRVRFKTERRPWNEADSCNWEIQNNAHAHCQLLSGECDLSSCHASTSGNFSRAIIGHLDIYRHLWKYIGHIEKTWA